MDIQTVIQGGAVGLAAFSMYIIYKLAGNHINHNTDALSGLKEVISELVTYLKENNGK